MKTVRSVVIGLTGIGIFMLVILHPAVPIGIITLVRSTITNTLGLAKGPTIG